LSLPCCWQKEQIDADECPCLQPGDQALRFDRRLRFLTRCLECSRFWENLQEADTNLQPLAELFPCVVEDLLGLRSQVQTLTHQIEARNREVRFLHEVSLVLQTSTDIDEVIAMALTAVTAGQGFGFNRAILLLVDQSRGELRGHLAIGPRDQWEAVRIWQEIAASDLSLREMARVFFERKMDQEREKFRYLLDSLTVPMTASDHLFIRTLENQVSCHIADLWQEPALDARQAGALGVRELVLVPLVSKNRPIGLLLADNIVNGRPIEAEDIHSLETFALPVSFALDRTALHEQLQAELNRTTEAHRRLQEQQETILRMEKMAAVGKVSADIAHSIRNPLTVIGGFARNLLKGSPEKPLQRHFLESIVRETRRMEETLKVAMAFAENQHPTYDWWDLNQLLTQVFTGLQEDLKIGGIDCRLEFQPGLPLVRLDYPQMSFCLRTLLRQILERLPSGTSLVIGTRGEMDRVKISFSWSLAGVAGPVFNKDFLTSDGGIPGLQFCGKILSDHGAVLDGEEGRAGFNVWLRRADDNHPAPG